VISTSRKILWKVGSFLGERSIGSCKKNFDFRQAFRKTRQKIKTDVKAKGFSNLSR